LRLRPCAIRLRLGRTMAVLAAPMLALGWPSTVAAQITEFPFPASNSGRSESPWAPGGALWFTETDNNKNRPHNGGEWDHRN
jgi:hypothetical protein